MKQIVFLPTGEYEDVDFNKTYPLGSYLYSSIPKQSKVTNLGTTEKPYLVFEIPKAFSQHEWNQFVEILNKKLWCPIGNESVPPEHKLTALLLT